MKRRWQFRLSVVLVAGFAALAGVYAAYWFVMTDRLRSGFLLWAEQQRAAGRTVTFAETARGGFPLAMQVIIERPTWSGRGPSPAWAWAVDRATLEARPWAQGLDVRITGRQALALRDGSGGAVEYTGGAHEFRVELQPGGWLPVGRLAMRGLAMTAAATGDSFAVERLDGTTSGDPAEPPDPGTAGYRLTLEAAGLRPPGALTLPLAGDIAHARLEAQVLGALARAPWPASVMAWRDQGGTIEVTQAEVLYGPLSFSGDGTFALDSRAQPIGAMTARARGWQQAIDALVARTVIKAGTAQRLKLVLGAVARAGSGGETLIVPLTLQDRVLSAGPVPLAQVPAIRWQSEAAGTT